MSKITVKTRLATLEFSSPTEAAQFVAELEGYNTQAVSAAQLPLQQHVPTKAEAVAAVRERDQLKRILDVLQAVRNEGPKGMPVESVAIVAGINGVRGLGAILGPMREQLESVGMELDAVVEIRRSHNGSSWIFGPEGDRAMHQLRRKLAG